MLVQGYVFLSYTVLSSLLKVNFINLTSATNLSPFEIWTRNETPNYVDGISYLVESASGIGERGTGFVEPNRLRSSLKFAIYIVTKIEQIMDLIPTLVSKGVSKSLSS